MCFLMCLVLAVFWVLRFVFFYPSVYTVPSDEPALNILLATLLHAAVPLYLYRTWRRGWSSMNFFQYGVLLSGLIFLPSLLTSQLSGGEKTILFTTLLVGMGLLMYWAKTHRNSLSIILFSFIVLAGLYMLTGLEPPVFYIYFPIFAVAMGAARVHDETLHIPDFFLPRWIPPLERKSGRKGFSYVEVLAATALLGIMLLTVTAVLHQKVRIETAVDQAGRATMILERELEKMIAQGPPPSGTDRALPLQEGNLQGATLRIQVLPYKHDSLVRVRLEIKWLKPGGGVMRYHSERLFYRGGLS
ncbi:type II secretion system protein J [Acidobacteriota bacterium]